MRVSAPFSSSFQFLSNENNNPGGALCVVLGGGVPPGNPYPMPEHVQLTLQP